ncbi:hypothetical protein [Nannocystis sp.]|uniref:hypothetical protein n=1 Tax=Nannocystis sp. TaxID=1962667 RepID=UPI0025E16C46|nr:hypothetical protein [Nannocystis sp.]MBK7830474.1 hypothetical protein [Nannocystis sp.]
MTRVALRSGLLLPRSQQVATPDLPDLRRLHRLGTGEVVGLERTQPTAAVHDPTTGAVLWLIRWR